MSIWNIRELKTKNLPLITDIETNILIIGAGMTGLTTAYYLQDEDITVVEANRVGHGVTLNTTAKITYLQDRIYSKIESLRGPILAEKYLKSQMVATTNILNIIEKEHIDCDLVKSPSYLLATTIKEKEKLPQEVEFLKRQNIQIKKGFPPIKIGILDSYYVEDTYTFNPIKYLESLYEILDSKKVRIFENSKIINVEKTEDGYICYTPYNKIMAKKIVFACHYPYFTIPFLLPLKSYIEKSHIIVSKFQKDENYTFITTDKPTLSRRFYKDGNDIYQISLSSSHNTAFKEDDRKNFEQVKKAFNLKEDDIILEYSNTDIISIDYMPYIGKLKENMYIACGYNTWGMTNSVLAASIISDAILEKDNEFEYTFSPNRLTLANIIKFPYILFSQTKSFISSHLFKNKSWYDGKVFFFKENGKNYATYTDREGVMHTIENRCPHLGCALLFNMTEETWDCPCHSSRYDVDGKCIKGPSLRDISKI